MQIWWWLTLIVSVTRLKASSESAKDISGCVWLGHGGMDHGYYTWMMVLPSPTLLVFVALLPHFHKLSIVLYRVLPPSFSSFEPLGHGPNPLKLWYKLDISFLKMYVVYFVSVMRKLTSAYDWYQVVNITHCVSVSEKTTETKTLHNLVLLIPDMIFTNDFTENNANLK